MTLRQYISVMVVATFLCWISWGMVIVNIDPFTAGNLSFVFFYTSLFLALIGTISMISFLYHKYLSRLDQPIFKCVKKSFRAGVIISFGLVFVLYLQGSELMSFWNFTILLIICALITSFTYSIQSSKNNSNIHSDSFLS